MTVRMTGTFGTRREAEMSVERLVQEFKLDRAAITIAAAGEANSAGEDRAGSDNAANQPGQEDRDDAALAGAIMVRVELADQAAADKVQAAFAEFGADEVDATEASR